ncbi:MAG: hypothetical protein LBG84_09300 [Treponema sp.]|jgi:hypothetical protein|nr:hypothetical protein [Treponema sp.]
MGSFNGDGSTFLVYSRQGWIRKRRARHPAPGSVFSRFFKVPIPGCAELITSYIRRISLLLRDLEFQLLAAEEIRAEYRVRDAGDMDMPEENPLEAYAITAHGIKVSSYGILALETARRAEELEHAALRGDLDFVKRRNKAFLDYMDYFMAGLARFLEREKRTDPPQGPARKTF